MRVLISILFCVIALQVNGQRISTMGQPTSIVRIAGTLTADSVMKAPTTKVIRPGSDPTGSYAVVGGLFWYHSGSQWIACETGGVIDTGIYATVYMLNTGLATKQNLLTVVTSGTSGPASMSGDTLLIPDYSAGSSFDTTHVYKAIADTAETLRSLIELKQGAINLTTIGSGGAATFDGTTLNIPEYENTTYSAGGWLAMSGTTIYLDTDNHKATDFSSPDQFHFPTTAAVNGVLADYYLASNPAGYTSNTGTVTSVGVVAGTGVSINGSSPLTTSGTFTVTNTAPDQTIVLNDGTGISVSGTYPNFTITNSSPSSGGTVTSVSVASANGFAGSVADPTTTPSITLTTTVNGLVKGDGAALSAATANVDYVTPSYLMRTFTTTNFTTSVTMDADSYNNYRITAQAGNLQINISASSPFHGQLLTLDINSSGAAHTISYGASVNNTGSAPTALSATSTTTTTWVFRYNGVGDWDYWVSQEIAH